ncbi:hypothetical protein Nepgr_026576 [Nepenthes gracilis]|uniref:CSC1/OSCA1-like 7TM region domain-containing protein n=1 Tax=Nepenthes gracilis TaxID=150966 RepID=A0AAD3Y0P5_NEPGR|nr:hypothetical protein Nepgr_026576 [Nepenthes gracilis]
MLTTIKHDPNTIANLRSTSLPGNTTFFLTFEALQFLVGYGLELPRLISLIIYHLKRKLVASTREHLNLNKVGIVGEFTGWDDKCAYLLDDSAEIWSFKAHSEDFTTKHMCLAKTAAWEGQGQRVHDDCVLHVLQVPKPNGRRPPPTEPENKREINNVALDPPRNAPRVSVDE